MNTWIAKAYRPAWMWALVILILTLTPGKFMPQVDYWSIMSLDKYVHMGIFFVQVLLILRGAKALKILTVRNYFIYALIGTVYGALIECIQQFIPLRSFDVNDMVANMAGALIAAAVFYIFEKAGDKKENNRI